MIKVKDGYAKLVGTTASGSASHILLSNGGIKAVSDFALADGTNATGTWSIDISGNAKTATTATTASKLSTVSKTAWGLTYWTSGGVPTSISGDMTGVGNINMTGSINSVLKATTSLGAALLNITEVTADTNYIHLYVSSLNSIAATTRALVLQNGYGNVGIGTPTPGYKLHVVGTTFSTGFVKSDSSDSYVLLGGGGHKSISSFQTTYDGRYVLKAGDTMTGPLTISTSNWGNLLVLNRVNNGENWGPSIIFKFDGTHNGALSMQSNLLYIGDNGNVRYKAWHEGNDGSGSGLDADLLDGKHASAFALASHTHTYIESKANYTFTSSTLPNSFDWGVSAGFVADNAGYGSYGSVLTVRTYTGGGGTLQLYAPYSKTYGGERLKARFGDYDSNVGNSWTTLKEIAWTSDIPNPTNYYWANVKVSASSNAATYPTFANMKSTGRVYLNEWIEFSGNTGLYWPNTHGAHFYPNDTSTYGQFKLLGSKGSYSGIHFGNSTSYLTVMSTDTHHGLYCENTGLWEFYYNRTNKQAGILTSSLTSGHALTVGGNISVIYNSYPGLTIHNNTTSGEASMYLKNNTAGWALGVNTWGVGAGSFGLGLYSGTGSSNCRLSIDNNGKVRIGTTSGNEMLNVGGWIGTVGNTGWYSYTHAGGWYMSDANWIRSYNSKPLCIDIGTNNTYGIGTHRLAAYFYGSGHVSILLSNNVCGWGICSNLDTNLYFGYRPSSSASTTTNDNYPSYLNKAGHWYASHYYESSDERLKDFGKDIEVDLDYIKQIPKKYFTFKKNPDKLEIGTSALVIQLKYPEIVNENNEGTLVLDYSKLSIIALKGIDNLYDLILNLQEENKELRDEINNLKTNKLWQS